MHPPTPFHKSFLHMILASSMGASGCTMAALTRHYTNLSPTGTACRLPSGTGSWHWCGVAEFRDSGESLGCTSASLRSRPAAGPGTHPEAIERLVQLHEALDQMHEGAKSPKELEGTEKPRDGFQVINRPT